MSLKDLTLSIRADQPTHSSIHVIANNISSRFSSNSEVLATKLQENLEVMFL